MNREWSGKQNVLFNLPAQGKKVTLRELLDSRCKQYKDKTFIIDPEKEKEYSYTIFQQKVNAVSNFLYKQGLRKDDKVSILMPNTPELLFSFFGIIQLGAVACPINTNLKTEELAYILDNSDSKALFSSLRYLNISSSALRSAAEKGKLQSLYYWDENGSNNAETIENLNQLNIINIEKEMEKEKNTLLPEVSKLQLDPDDTAELIYTSGTTGRPKGAMLTHHNLIIDSHWIAYGNGLTENDRSMCVMPLFHINGQVVTVLTPLFHGGSVILPERFSVTRFFPLINSYGVTYVGTVATMLSMLINKANTGDISKESKLRIVFCGSAPVPGEVMSQFEKTFRVPIIEGYGMTETSCRSTFNPLPPQDALKLGENDGYRKIGSVGLPLGNEMKVIDDEGNSLGPDEIGEIVIRGENVSKGYYKDEESTNKAFRGDWFHSGDLGYYDNEGYFYLVDRKNDMIIRGGENIYPREIEEVLYSHSLVRNAACIGIPDELYGEEVIAFIELKDDEQVKEEDIISFCRQHLADYKCPKQINVVEEIPKSSSGKLLRKELKKIYG